MYITSDSQNIENWRLREIFLNYRCPKRKSFLSFPIQVQNLLETRSFMKIAYVIVEFLQEKEKNILFLSYILV